MENTQRSDLLEVVECSWLGNFPDLFSFEIAFSGGVDSVVLLDVMYRLRQKYSFTLSAVHVHHGLQHQADEWAEFCTKVCQQYAIPLRVEYVSVNSDSPLGIEGEARQCRYKAFQGSKQAVVVLAHHQNDQIETFLLAMLRGGGLRGMVSMPVSRVLIPKIALWRPLLSVDKAEIERYAQINTLKYIQDPSNVSEDYTRNWIRKILLPAIKNKNPFAERHILKNIDNLQDSLSIIDEVKLQDYARCTGNDVIFIEPLLHLSQPRAKEVLLYFLKQHQLGNPRRESINDFIKWLFSNLGHTYEWQVPGGKIYVYDKKIWFWSDNNELTKRLEAGYFTHSDVTWLRKKKGVSLDFVDQSWSIRPVNKNDTIHTEIGVQSVLGILKKNKVPYFIRHYWPVIVDTNGRCIIVVGLRVDIRYQRDDAVVPIIEKLELYLKQGN